MHAFGELQSCFRNTKCDKDPWKVYARIASREEEQGKHSRLDRCSGLIWSRGRAEAQAKVPQGLLGYWAIGLLSY